MKQWSKEIEINAPIEECLDAVQWLFGRNAKNYASSCSRMNPKNNG